MSNIYDQVTPDDFKAPTGKFRIMREEMSDGQLSIVCDFYFRQFAVLDLESLREAHPNDVFTLCDENGVIEEEIVEDPLNAVSDRAIHNMYKK